jgi:hypothetical protein
MRKRDRTRRGRRENAKGRKREMRTERGPADCSSAAG